MPRPLSCFIINIIVAGHFYGNVASFFADFCKFAKVFANFCSKLLHGFAAFILFYFILYVQLARFLQPLQIMPTATFLNS